jgi:hypothetical protein
MRIGQGIRLLRVPEGDLIQREHERQSGEIEDPGWTADTIERILARDPIVTISTIDEHGIPRGMVSQPTAPRSPHAH